MMNNFTVLIKESKDSTSILLSEISDFIKNVKSLPQSVKNVIHLTKKYNLTNKEQIEEIKYANKSKLNTLSTKYKMSSNDIEDLWKMLKEIKNDIYLLPQYMSENTRKELEAGQLATNDLTIDLSTSHGRNAAAKMYTPLVNVIVNQFLGKSKLSKPELFSAGLIGLTNAMNDWDRERGVPFKTYAGQRIRQQILNDINEYSHSLSGTSWYSKQKGDNVDAVSLDQFIGMNDDGDFKQDRLAALGVEDKAKESEKDWQPLYKLLEDKFKRRDVDIFYRIFGLNGYKREKSKDIAKEFGWSEGNIRNSIINKIIKFLRTDSRAISILQHIQDTYNESLLVSLCGMDKNNIIEALVNDDIFILLEELNRWNNKEIFRRTLENSLLELTDMDSSYILDVLEKDFNYLDDTFKKHKKIIILFLSNMYPSEIISKKSDVALLDYMTEVQNAYQKYSK